MRASVVIPARYGSTRFPAKMVAAATGRPLVQHVVDRVKQCHRVDRVVVATDDARIADALRPFGTDVVMTSPAHPSGTDRVAEAAEAFADDELILNVQGDEPEIEPETVDRLVETLAGSDDPVATVATPFPAGADVHDPNLVKVVVGVGGRAIYFSRAAIPFPRDREPSSAVQYLLHLGLYAYRRPALLRLARLSPTPLEQTEKLEQLRVLEHGWPMVVTVVDRPTHGIDTPEQYRVFVERFRHSQTQGPARRP